MDNEPLKVFISHSTKDAIIVGGIKSSLEFYGIGTFIAHEDIDPSKEWEEEIIKNLELCDIFMPILTSNFKDSYWCDQESGIAFNMKKMIMPLTIDLKPYGFLSRYQSLKIDKDDIRNSCRRIINTLKEDDKFKEKIKDCLITSLLKSKHFSESNEKVLIVKEMEPFNKEQINKIMVGFIENDELTNAFQVIDHIKIWVNKYSDDIEPSIGSEVIRLLKNPNNQI